ncbi:hypothetical protein [Pseudotabrizicola sp. 4114]|uniref:hypothetical protein n=1 Tax=Pseudotabrizicola sp. 4114 TaxID=2817731 RepID=UPI0032B7F52D
MTCLSIFFKFLECFGERYAAVELFLVLLAALGLLGAGFSASADDPEPDNPESL